jgi:hypothetical protein
MEWLIGLTIITVVIVALSVIGLRANEVDWDSRAINIIDGWMHSTCQKRGVSSLFATMCLVLNR